MDVIYRYDGSFQGFLCCVFESYVHREPPMGFQGPEDLEPTLFPVRWVEADSAHAHRIAESIRRRSAWAGELTEKGFLTCAPDREMMLFRFIAALYSEGPSLLRRLSDAAVLPLLQAVRHLEGEAHLLKGFVRFSDLGGTLVGEIAPKNRVLPLLRPHFCARFYNERLLLYDRTHREALFYQGGRWGILPLDHFEMARPDAREAEFRRLWKRFYDTVAIRERYNPTCRRTQMPMRYWGTMTEFQGEDFFRSEAERSLPDGAYEPAPGTAGHLRDSPSAGAGGPDRTRRAQREAGS